MRPGDQGRHGRRPRRAIARGREGDGGVGVVHVGLEMQRRRGVYATPIGYRIVSGKDDRSAMG